MKTKTYALRGLAAAACLVLALPMAAQAQNIAVVNGKAVPKSRADALIQQVTRSGQQLPPGSDQRIRDETVLREIFAQEAERTTPSPTPTSRPNTTNSWQPMAARNTVLVTSWSKKKIRPRPSSPV